MAALAEAYIRLRPFQVSEERIQVLGLSTDEIARETAALIFPFPVEIEVDLIEGTLTGKIVAAGAIIAGGLGFYANIGGAIDTTQKLCNMSKTFSQVVCDRFVENSGAVEGQVERVEKRTKTPGRLLRALKRIERLDRAAGSLTKEQLQLELSKARKQLQQAIAGMSRDEVEILTTLQLTNLPPVHEWPNETGITIPRVALQREPLLLETERRQLPLPPRREEKRLLAPPTRDVRRPRLRYHNVFSVHPEEEGKTNLGGTSLILPSQ